MFRRHRSSFESVHFYRFIYFWALLTYTQILTGVAYNTSHTYMDGYIHIHSVEKELTYHNAFLFAKDSGNTVIVTPVCNAFFMAADINEVELHTNGSNVLQNANDNNNVTMKPIERYENSFVRHSLRTTNS